MGDSEYKLVRLNPEVKGLLDDYKMEGESYAIAIGRLFKENEILRDSQDRLMKMAMETDDSISLINVNHKTIFAIIEVLNMEGKSDADKIQCLKIYLRPSLEENASSVLSCISSFIEENPKYAPILEELSSWIRENYDVNKKITLQIDEDLLSVWEEMMEDNPDREVLNLSDFVRNQMEWTLYKNHYIGTGVESREELEEMRKKRRKLEIPR